MSTNVAKPVKVAIVGASGTYGKGILARAEEIGVQAVVVTRSPHKFKDVKPTTTVVETQLDEEEKKFTSTEISRQLECDGQKLFLHVFKEAAEREKGNRKYKVWQNEYHPQLVYSQRLLSKTGIHAQQPAQERLCRKAGRLGSEQCKQLRCWRPFDSQG